MKRWIYVVALIALCHHPLFAQSDSATELSSPKQMPQLAIAQLLDNGAIKIDLIRPQESQTDLRNDSKGISAVAAEATKTRHYEVQVPYVVRTEKQYTVQVPYEVEIVGADGNPKMITRTREEERTRIVPITRIRTEQRESKVVVANSRSSSVATLSAKVAPGQQQASCSTSQQLRFALNEVQFYSPRGERVHQNIAAKQLRFRQPIVLLGDHETLSPFLQQLLRPETLVVQRKR